MIIWRNIDWNITLFADDCIVYREITNKNDIEKYKRDLDTLGEWAVESGMKINPDKSKAVRFTKARLKNPLGYSFGGKELTRRFKLGGPSKLHSAKSLEGISLCNACSKKKGGGIGIQKFSLHVIGTSCS